MAKSETEVNVTRRVVLETEGLSFEDTFKAALAAGVPVNESEVNYDNSPYVLSFEWEDVVSFE